ncbi:hypothetical protein HYV73_03850 [Candidatus Uhrbacteria bacterium]|nr:hypothetical protein [Candidatus Uhrbacteria bacterium]
MARIERTLRETFANREIGGVKFGWGGFTTLSLESETCPFCGGGLGHYPEYGVGGHLENLQVWCRSCGFVENPYDGGLTLPDEWMKIHLPEQK